MYSTYYKTTKKKTVAKLKVTRKLEDILPAFYIVFISRHHNKKKLPSQQLLFPIPHPVPTGLYQRFFKYIDDFYTFIGDFSLYRRFDIGYRLTDNFRQSIYTLYPATTIKEVTLTATPFPYTPPSTNRIISAIFQIYRRFLHFYGRFFHYIDDST